jgi:hypothetical protein
MGEAHSISLTANGPVGPDAPGAIEVTSSAESEGMVSIPTDQGEAEVTEAPEVAVERPEWLPEKFESAEALAEAYKSLEGHMGAEPAETEAAEEDTETVGVSTEVLTPYAEEYYSTGELAEDSYVALEGMGLSRELVTAFMQGQQAVQSAELNKIYESAGGQEAYHGAMAWAAQNMGPEEIQAYNAQVESGDITTATIAVKGLMARFAQGDPTPAQPALLQSEPAGPGGIAPYQSLAQVMEDMKSPQYKTDPAFRAKVEARLSNSDVM